jgi:hypothetical protein
MPESSDNLLAVLAAGCQLLDSQVKAGPAPVSKVVDKVVEMKSLGHVTPSETPPKAALETSGSGEECHWVAILGGDRV